MSNYYWAKFPESWALLETSPGHLIREHEGQKRLPDGTCLGIWFLVFMPLHLIIKCCPDLSIFFSELQFSHLENIILQCVLETHFLNILRA